MNERLAPHARTEATSSAMIRDVLLLSFVLCGFSTVSYGLRPMLVVLLSVLAAMVSETVCCLIRRRPLNTLLDGSAAVTGAIIGLVMSPMVDYWVPMLGAAFGLLKGCVK